MIAKILVVDDDPTARQSLKAVFEESGYDVVTAENGEIALQRVKQGDIGVMLLDIGMPGMDGIEILKRCKDIAPDTRVVMITGRATLESALEAIRHDAFDYILKPAATQELLSAVARALKSLEEERRRRLILEKIDQSVHELKEVEGMVEDLPRPRRRLIDLPDGVTFDLARRELWRGSQHVRLTPAESKLMEIFIRSWGTVISHTDLVFLLQGYEIDPESAPEILRPLISRLRRKLNTFPNGARWIASVRGRGYVFDAERPSG